jgi:hypothetical protein
MNITRGTLRSLAVAGGLLLAVFLIASAIFISTMYAGRITQESVIEASHYAMQTVTTVGYGNWETPALTTTTYSPEDRLAMRGYSVFFMGLGAVVFAVFVAAVVSIFVPPS